MWRWRANFVAAYCLFTTNILMYFVSFYRHAYHVLEDPAMNDIVTFFVVFVCSPNYISNPYLVAKIVEVCENDL